MVSFFSTKKIYYCFFLLLCSSFLAAQNCNISLKGQVLDESTQFPLPYATIFLEETKAGDVADSLGFFEIKNICKGDYHIRFSHIGCEMVEDFLSIKKDTFIVIYLHHHSELMNEVVVHGDKDDNTSQVSSTIGKEEIEREANKNIADILENITGVSVLKTGSGISKPMVHGLYGNRVSILNNGITQSGQQWGNDHSPEIDPFVADHLAVIKGASALAYGGNSLGGVVLVEKDDIKKDPHLHGDVQYIFQTNGFGNTLNVQLGKFNDVLAWQITGTLKKIGDMKTPTYFLRNTGKEEGNIAIQLEKRWSEHWKSSAYYSLFNTKMGILRGSHVGNLSDLEAAIGRAEPFFTQENFSYKIAAPHQAVQHHLLKTKTEYLIDNHRFWHFQYGGQLNNRKEFDVRRSGRSDIPALSLLQHQHFGEAVYKQTFENESLLKTGVQLTFIDNTNNPETEILPLIPDYRNHQAAAFLIFHQQKNKFFYEIGGRYDFKNLNAITISRTLPRKIERFSHFFHNYSLSTGLKYEINDIWNSNFNVGYVLRSPEVNELYSSGLHQGVSGIEEGNADLKNEKSLKFVFSNDFRLKQKIFIEALAYFQNINNYIYLEPQEELRLTIRGAFPVFEYKQTNAQLFGTDILLSYEPFEHLKWIMKYAIVRGNDLKNEVSLINMPADNVFSSVSYSFPTWRKFENSELQLNGRYVFRQDRISAEQDFLVPPDAYFLMGLQANTSLHLPQSDLKFSVNINNALNTTYRDYLNRQRYFADEVGFNANIGVKYSF